MFFKSSLHRALCAALDDEYRARATYRAIIDAFGPVPPFVHIIQSEQRHIDTLLSLFFERGLAAIADPYADGLPAPPSIETAYRIAIIEETENAVLYDRLMEAAAGDEEVSWVFRMLQRASAECHLSAFRRALEGRLVDSCNGCGRHHGGKHCRRGHRRQSTTRELNGTTDFP